MNLRAAILPFMDEDGLVIERRNRSPGPETGNGIRERCLLELLCYKRNETTKEHVEDFTRVIRSCEVPGYKGLYHRGPRKVEEMAAHDDRRCLSSISYILNLPFAEDIHDFGKSHCWAYDNLDPGSWSFRTWDDRFPGLVGAYRLFSDHKTYPLENVGLGGAILASAWSKSPKQKIYWFMMIEALESMGEYRSVISQWWLSLFSQYGSMRNVFKAYYEDVPNHPYIELSPV